LRPVAGLVQACWMRPTTGWQYNAAGVGKGTVGIIVGAGGVTVAGLSAIVSEGTGV
jgi:hypothetical protein